MTPTTQQPMRWALFTSFAPAGPPGVMWHHPKALTFDYMNLDHWIELSRALEAAKFDAIFWADHSGVHDIYQNSYATAVREAVQFPIGDPVLLTAALASATEDLGFAFSANVIQDHPYAFARRLGTLDHLTRGRIAWNIVTSFQPSAWRNLGYEQVDSHSARYERAEEYLQVVYKLLMGSWSDDAVVRDTERRIYATPDGVRPIRHEGHYYRVPGIATTAPGPQRLPVLFQAGSSDDGRAFSARHAEAVFLAARNPDGAQKQIDDTTGRLKEYGRRRSDILFFQHLNVVLGSTEEEARRKDEEAQSYLSSETSLAFTSSTLGTDLAVIDLDTPVGDFATESLQGGLKGLAEAAPDKAWTFRDIAMRLTRLRFVGTPEQFVVEAKKWQAAGVDGINLGTVTGMSDTYTFLEHAVPVLREHGLIQQEYSQGTLRQKLFAHSDEPAGPRPNKRHPSSSVSLSGDRGLASMGSDS